MLQIFEALIDTVMRFGDRYGPKVALAVLAVIGVGIVLRILTGVLHRGGTKES